MTAKTLRNNGCSRAAKTQKNKWSIDYSRPVWIDCSRGLSREQRASIRRNKVTSSLISNRSPRTREYMNMKRFDKLMDAEKRLDRYASKQRAEEAALFHDFSNRVPSSINFEEKSFGNSDLSCQNNYLSANNAQALSSIVVSLALFDGKKMLYACSGIPIPDDRLCQLRLSRFATTAHLVKEFNDHRNRDDKLRVEVRLPDGSTADGFLGLYDVDIAIVTSIGFLGVKPVDLDLDAPADPEGSTIAAGRAFKRGSLMTTNVPATESDYTWISDSPNFSEAVLGGPLVEVKNPSGGNGMRFLGMNLRPCCSDDANVRYTFLSRDALRQRLKLFQILDCKELHFREYSLPNGVSSIIPSGFVHIINRIEALGYPMPPPLVLEFNGELLNQFEGYFGRVRAWTRFPFGDPPAGSGQLVWERLSKKAVTDISRRVVSLSSFKGDRRFFACSGLLIKCHARTLILTSASLVRGHDGLTIDKHLRIKVSLPPDQCANGTLELYNLSSNYAIVRIDKNFHTIRPEDIFNKKQKSPKKVVAVGRDATLGLLMASLGEVKPGNSEYTMMSTCIINKAGIGGPLIDFGGNFVGMNFYNGSKLTPVVPKNKIVEALGRVENVEILSERSSRRYMDLDDPIEIDDDGNPVVEHPDNLDITKWNAPKPYWYHGGLDVSRYHIPMLRGRTLL